MRLPVTPQISTKDGVSAKNARLTNCLKEVKKSGEKAVIRPGLLLSDTYTGLGSGLIPFDGRLLLAYADTIYDQNDNGTWPLDAPQWSVSTTYAFGDPAWLNGDLWFSQTGGNIGNTPGSSSQWKRQPTDTSYDPAATYAIGDTVLSGGVTYYSYAPSNVGHTPAEPWWSTTAPTTARYVCNGISGGYGGSDPGPECASRDAAQAARCATTTLYYSCATRNLSSDTYYIWSDNYVSANLGYVMRRIADFSSPCVAPDLSIGYVQLGTFTQTHA